MGLEIEQNIFFFLLAQERGKGTGDGPAKILAPHRLALAAGLIALARPPPPDTKDSGGQTIFTLSVLAPTRGKPNKRPEQKKQGPGLKPFKRGLLRQKPKIPHQALGVHGENPKTAKGAPMIGGDPPNRGGNWKKKPRAQPSRGRNGAPKKGKPKKGPEGPPIKQT